MMAFGLRIMDGHGKLRGVWFLPDEHTTPEALMLDDWEQMLADEKIDDAVRLLPTAMPVQRDWEAEPVKMDWLDVLVREARPSTRAVGEQIEGPFTTDEPTAEKLLEFFLRNPEPVPEEQWVKRIYVP